MAEKEHNDGAKDLEVDWAAIAANAEFKVNQAIEQLSLLLITRNRLEILGRIATYILFTPGGRTAAEEHRQNSEVNLEYLCSIATALPHSPAQECPSADDVQCIIDSLATIHTHATVCYTAFNNSSDPEANALEDLSKSFQLQKLHVRGDGYEHHLKQTWHDMMKPHVGVFKQEVGFTFDDYIGLTDRLEAVIEDRINQESDQKHVPYRNLLRPWMDELQSGNQLSAACQKFMQENEEVIKVAKTSFDAFGSSDSFLVIPASAQEERILRLMSCDFGDNSSFAGEKKRFLFWPLNETVTDKKPFIHHCGKYYALNFAKIGRTAYDLLSNALRDANPKYWQKQFLSARDTYLEKETAHLFQKVLPAARVLSSVFYPLAAGGCAEADVVVIMDEVLLVVECKAGAITPPAKRGAPLRVKKDVGKTVAEGLNQAERLVAELVARIEMMVETEDGEKVLLKADEFRWVFRINVTLDLISTVASNIWSLSDIGLVNSTERCWSVSLNDLRVIVEILDQPAVFLHYLIRRFDTDQLRNVEAPDELDYMMYYLLQGLFFRGKNKLKEHENLTIGRYTDDLDQYYRRKQGQADKGAKPRVMHGPHTQRFLELLEKWQPKGWMTAALHFLEFDRPTREALLAKTNLHFKTIRAGRSRFGMSVNGCSETRTAIALACSRNPEAVKEVVRARCISRCKDYGFDTMIGILVGMPVAAHSPIILCVSPNDSASEHAKRLLAQLRFNVTEHPPKESRPGIFDGIRED